jgi:hypothetical protein
MKFSFLPFQLNNILLFLLIGKAIVKNSGMFISDPVENMNDDEEDPDYQSEMED